MNSFHMTCKSSSLGPLVAHLVLVDLLSGGYLLRRNSDGLLLVCSCRCKYLYTLLDLCSDHFALCHLVCPHPHLEEHILSLRLDFADLLHRLERRLHCFTVVLDGPIPPLLKLICRIYCHFFACILTERLCPFHLTRVAFPSEVFVTLGSAKLKNFAIISNERLAMTRIDRA